MFLTDVGDKLEKLVTGFVWGKFVTNIQREKSYRKNPLQPSHVIALK